MARPQVADGGDSLQIWTVAANILNKQLRIDNRGCPRVWGLGVGITTLHRKMPACYEVLRTDGGGFPLLITNSPLLHTHVSLSNDVCDSPDQVAHYHILGLKLGASFLTGHLAGFGEKVLLVLQISLN
jgi:hypothetical protein